jgi:hypothetical protein
MIAMSSLRLTILWVLLLCHLSAQDSSRTAQRTIDSEPCSEVVLKMVPAIHSESTEKGLAHVEVRRCHDTGALQLAAWREQAEKPTLVLDISRFSLSQALMNGNVFAVIAPGGYDTVIVLQYKHGKPAVVFTDSTHSDIALSSDSGRVIVSFAVAGETTRESRTFQVDEDQVSGTVR